MDHPTPLASSRPEAQASEAVLLREVGDGVATLILNRPKQYNALSVALLTELQSALDAIAQDSAIRVVVIAGNGPAFCAGHDLKEMRANYELLSTEALFAQCSRIMTSITGLPQPVIAKVHGIATAAGCQLVAQCDLAIASAQARFATSGVNVGLFCSTPGVALSRNVSRKQAMEMLLTGEFIDARTARDRGLVNRVVAPEDLDDAVRELVDAIKGKPAAVIAQGKETFYRQVEMPLQDAYMFASSVMACNFMMPEAAEGVDAFMQKRPPKW
jgi:enoyl-CoA hydratase/carnithine racemase